MKLPESGRVLALDLGHKRVGLALSDDLRITAQPYATLEPRGTDDLLESVRLQRGVRLRRDPQIIGQRHPHAFLSQVQG